MSSQLLQRVDRTGERIEGDLGDRRWVRTRAPRAATAARAACRPPCAPGRRRPARAGARARSGRPPRGRARRARCGVDRTRRRGSRPAAHFQIMTSSPTSTSEPGFTPAARSASSSSSPSGAVPTTRNPWPVRSTSKRRRSGGFGRYSRNAGSASPPARAPAAPAGAEREEQALELVDPCSRRARDAVDGDDPLVLDGERRRLRVEIGLVEDDELRALAEAGAVGGELAVDHAVALVGVALGGVDHVQQEPGPLEVGQELVAEPDALARALDQARHVGDRQLATVGAVDRAEHRCQRRERVVGDLRLRVRDPAQERGLAGVRQPGAGGVGHELQVQLQLARLPRQARLGVPRRLPRRRGEVRVATTAAAPARDDDPGAVLAEVGHGGPVLDVRDLGPTGTVRTMSSPSAPCLRVPRPFHPVARRNRLRAEGREIAQIGVGNEDDVAAAAAVAAVRPALGHELLAPEAEAAVAAAARLDANADAIVEHAHRVTRRRITSRRRPRGTRPASSRARRPR